MPAKNSCKQYLENSFYHLYNRGVEKRIIFQDQQDYSVFLSYLKEYLTFKNEKKMYLALTDDNLSWRERDKIIKLLRLNNFYDEVQLITYCLMPNHFHLLVKQKSAESIDCFMNSLCTRYTMYFNRKYKRVGSLYQGVYKAVLVETEEQLLHLSRYIHKQAKNRQPCSYPEHLKKRKTPWLHPEIILSYFSTKNPLLSYQVFVEQTNDISHIGPLVIERV